MGIVCSVVFDLYFTCIGLVFDLYWCGWRVESRRAKLQESSGVSLRFGGCSFGQLQRIGFILDVDVGSCISLVLASFSSRRLREPGFEDWVMPLSKDADKGHNCERVRIEARKKFRYITDREYEYQLKMWRRENPEWRKWKL